MLKTDPHKNWLLALKDEELSALHASLCKAAEGNGGAAPVSLNFRAWEDSLLSTTPQKTNSYNQTKHASMTSMRFSSPTGSILIRSDDEICGSHKRLDPFKTSSVVSVRSPVSIAAETKDNAQFNVDHMRDSAQSPLFTAGIGPEWRLSPNPESPSAAHSPESPLRSFQMPWIVDSVERSEEPIVHAKARAPRTARAPSTIEVVEGLAQVQRAQNALAQLKERIASDGRAAASSVVHRLADCLLWQQEVGQALAAMRRSGNMSLEARNEELERQVQATGSSKVLIELVLLE